MSLLKHLLECADEMGADLTDATSSEETIEHNGRKIEVYYNESRCRWYAFVPGIGDSTGGIDGNRQGAIDAAKQKIDRSNTNEV